jgi:hypothetical protein
MRDPILPGRAAEPVQNEYLAPGRQRVREPGVLAVGHRPAGAVVPGAEGLSEHLGFQQVAPSGAAVLHQVADRPGPLADAIVGHQAMARVQAMDQMRASNPALAPQLAARAPSPVPGQPAPAAAVPDNGAPFRGFAPRDPGIYNREPRHA